MSDTATAPTSAPARAHRLGLPVLALVGLALLRVPGPLLEDLGVIRSGDPIAWALAWAPVVVWVLVVVLRKAARPFLTVLTTGLISGALLVLAYQLFWEQLFGDFTSADLTIRLIAIPGGLVNGALFGAIGGLVAAGIRVIVTRRDR